MCTGVADVDGICQKELVLGPGDPYEHELLVIVEDKSYVCKAINESEIAKHSALQGIYLPEELRSGFIHVDVDPERVIIDAARKSRPLRSSLLYKKMFR